MATTALRTDQAHRSGDQVPLRRRSRDRRREALAGYLFISPWIIGFLLFTLGAMIYSLVISFSHYNLANVPTYDRSI
jgi:multiple sugar transport system permease protein